jgi:hypothetical protein
MSKETTKENLKTIPVRINKEIWKKIKILSVQREITLEEQVRDMIEKSLQNKRVVNIGDTNSIDQSSIAV